MPHMDYRNPVNHTPAHRWTKAKPPTATKNNTNPEIKDSKEKPTMTMAPPNQTRTCIEEALASAEYGEKVINLGNQYRREGNQIAANAALATTWDIRDKIKKVIAILPILTPEHTDLLEPSERQNLVGELTAHSNRLDQMISEHPVTEEQLGNSNSDHIDWHIACIHAGYLVHLARKNTERVNQMPDNDMMAEIAHYAVSSYHDEVLQSEKIIRNQEPSDDEPFPMTRTQVREQALKDCAELADLHTDLNTKVEAMQAQADKPPGWCHLCRQTIHGDEAVEHSRICVVAAVHNVFALREEYESRNNPVLIHIQDKKLRHWMTITVRPTTSLRQQDQFLRDIWLECCGHMSHFQVGKKQYSACVPGPGDHHDHDTDKADPDELHMVRTVEEAIRPHREFQHEFDYGDTTYLNLEHAGVVPVPYECVAELANAPWNADKYSDHFITIVARNKPAERCFTCGQTASLRYYENPYIHVPREMDGPIVAPPYFCSDCSLHDVPMVTLRNSPRVGNGCYDNTHDTPNETNSTVKTTPQPDNSG